MTGDFEIDDMLKRHGPAIAAAILPEPVKFTVVDAFVLAVGVYVAILLGAWLHFKPYVIIESRGVEAVGRPGRVR